MPGTMTLVCGPPGCGKSSFHKALAGRLFIDDTTTLNGVVSYNGKDISDIQVRRIAAFIAQSDRHLPTLTVRETCAFANTCTSHYNKIEYNFADDPNLAREASWLKNENLPLEMTLHLLGLRGVMDTPIGNTTIRGVSGGERHRVTTAEMVSGTFLVYFLDEISTGLDSSAAYDIVSTFRTYARIKQFTCLFSLLQPSPEVFDLFDRIIVLNEGRIIFQGPRGDVLSYFKTLGYVKPNHVDVADFLQEVTTEEGIHFLLPEFRHLTSNEFVKAYMDSDMYKDVLRIVNNTQNVQELWLDVAKPLGLSIVNKPSKSGEKGIVVVDKVEASGMATAVNIQHTADVKEGDTIMAIGVVGEELEYLGLPMSTLDAFGIFGKVAEAPRNIILQLERPLEKEDEEAASVFKQEYVQEWWPSTKTVLQRQATLVLRNKSFVYARIVQVIQDSSSRSF
jgi:ABC-type multidrug transport system ATPase subunit